MIVLLRNLASNVYSLDDYAALVIIHDIHLREGLTGIKGKKKKLSTIQRKERRFIKIAVFS